MANAAATNAAMLPIQVITSIDLIAASPGSLVGSGALDRSRSGVPHAAWPCSQARASPNRQCRYAEKIATPSTGTHAASSAIGRRIGRRTGRSAAAPRGGHHARQASGSASQNPLGRVSPASNPHTTTQPTRPRRIA